MTPPTRLPAMSMLINEQRDDRVVLRRLRRMQRLRRRRQRRTDQMLQRALEVLGWLTAILILIYAGHAAFAHAPRVTDDVPRRDARLKSE